MTINRRKFLKFFGLGAVATVVPAKLVAATEPSKRLLILKPRSPGISISYARLIDKDKYLVVAHPDSWVARAQAEGWVLADQWSPEEIAKLEKRGASPLKLNRITF